MEPIADLNEGAVRLADFIVALHQLDARGGPRPGEHNFFRGVPLVEREERTREAIVALPPAFDSKTIISAWEQALQSPQWQGDPVWLHGDLAAGNLLVQANRVVGVLDWGGLAVGDPACDLMPAWTLLSGESRVVFKTALDADDSTWDRARGWTLSVALCEIPYYLEKAPVIVSRATHAIDEVLADPAL